MLSILEGLGLSPNEGKIYLALLETHEGSVASIASRTSIHRRNIYDTLERMLEKGIIFEIFETKERRFSPVHPQKLLEILKEKEHAFRRALPQLELLYSTQLQEQAAYIYRGLEGYKNYMRDLVRIGETTYFLGAKALWFSSNVEPHFLTNFQREMRRKKLDYYTLFDHRVYEQIPKAMSKVSGQYKVLPAKYNTPAVCDIAGEYVFIFNSAKVGEWGEDGAVFVLRNKLLADSFRTWFQFIWDFCPEVAKREHLGTVKI